MATRNLYLPGHIQGVVNQLAADGTPFCHVLIEDDANGTPLVAAIKPPSMIYDSGAPGADFDALAAKYKRTNGEPLHVFLGNDVRPPPIISEAPELP